MVRAAFRARRVALCVLGELASQRITTGRGVAGPRIAVFSFFHDAIATHLEGDNSS